MEFTNVAAVAKANVYFDGNVVSQAGPGKNPASSMHPWA